MSRSLGAFGLLACDWWVQAFSRAPPSFKRHAAQKVAGNVLRCVGACGLFSDVGPDLCGGAETPTELRESTVSRIPKKCPDEGQSSWVSAIANCNVKASVQVAASRRASFSTVILQSGADVHSAGTSRFPKDLFRLEVGSSNWPAVMLKLQLASRQTLYSEFVATLTPLQTIFLYHEPTPITEGPYRIRLVGLAGLAFS